MYVHAKDGSIQLLSIVLLQDQFTCRKPHCGKRIVYNPPRTLVVLMSVYTAFIVSIIS